MNIWQNLDGHYTNVSNIQVYYVWVCLQQRLLFCVAYLQHHLQCKRRIVRPTLDVHAMAKGAVVVKIELGRQCSHWPLSQHRRCPQSAWDGTALARSVTSAPGARSLVALVLLPGHVVYLFHLHGCKPKDVYLHFSENLGRCRWWHALEAITCTTIGWIIILSRTCARSMRQLRRVRAPVLLPPAVPIAR